MKSFLLILTVGLVCSSMASAQVLTRKQVNDATIACATELAADVFSQFLKHEPDQSFQLSDDESPQVSNTQVAESGIAWEKIYFHKFEVYGKKRGEKELSEMRKAFVLNGGAAHYLNVTLSYKDYFAPNDMHKHNGDLILTTDVQAPAVYIPINHVTKKFDRYGRPQPEADEFKSFSIAAGKAFSREVLKNYATKAATEFSLDLAQYSRCLSDRLNRYINNQIDPKNHPLERR